MSDIMLHGVLNMPPKLWSGEPIDVRQRHLRYVQASEYIYELIEQRNKLAEALREAWLLMDKVQGDDRIDEWQNKYADNALAAVKGGSDE